MPIKYTGRGLVEYHMNTVIRTNDRIWRDIFDASSECRKLIIEKQAMIFRPSLFGYAWDIQPDGVGNLWAWFDPAASLIACVRYQGKSRAVLYAGYDCNDLREGKPKPKPTAF